MWNCAPLTDCMTFRMYPWKEMLDIAHTLRCSTSMTLSRLQFQMHSVVWLEIDYSMHGLGRYCHHHHYIASFSKQQAKFAANRIYKCQYDWAHLMDSAKGYRRSHRRADWICELVRQFFIGNSYLILWNTRNIYHRQTIHPRPKLYWICWTWTAQSGHEMHLLQQRINTLHENLFCEYVDIAGQKTGIQIYSYNITFHRIHYGQLL